MRQIIYTRGEIVNPDTPGWCVESAIDCEVEGDTVTKLYSLLETALVRTDSPPGSCPVPRGTSPVPGAP